MCWAVCGLLCPLGAASPGLGGVLWPLHRAGGDNSRSSRSKQGETRLSGRSWDDGCLVSSLLILHLEWKLDRAAEPCLAELLAWERPWLVPSGAAAHWVVCGALVKA